MPKHLPKKLNRAAFDIFAFHLNSMILVLVACDVENNKAGRRLQCRQSFIYEHEAAIRAVGIFNGLDCTPECSQGHVLTGM